MSFEKRGLFTSVNETEFSNYIKTGYFDEPDSNIKIALYRVSFSIITMISMISLAYFYKLRNSYIIRQRNFTLTFIGGIAAYINVFLDFLPQFKKVPCSLNVFSENFINPLVYFIFLSRCIRIILFYHFNIFKVSSFKKIKELDNYDISVEPNKYLPNMTKKINKIITAVIITPTIISVLSTIFIYNYFIDELSQECKLSEPIDTLLQFKSNKGRKLYCVFQVFGVLYIIISSFNAYFLYHIKDSNKYGMKFECFTVSILIIIANAISIFLQCVASGGHEFDIVKYRPPRFVLTLFNYTKGGKILYTNVIIYMIFVSITLPVIQYFKMKTVKNDYFQDPMSSIQYFYKILNNPSLVEELRDIAVKEFSVENVLFWENYQILQKMVYQYQTEYARAKELGDEKMIDQILSQYDFEGYYKEQIRNYAYLKMNVFTYDPNMRVPKEILPYYTSFYSMFIDFNGLAVVNISGNTVKKIYNEMATYPTVGIFDEAKNEIVENMYRSIYPILLKNNRKYIEDTIC